MNFGYFHNIIIQRNRGSDFRPMGLISVSGGLISDPWGLKPDQKDLNSDPGGLKSGWTENPILIYYFFLTKRLLLGQVSTTRALVTS